MFRLGLCLIAALGVSACGGSETEDTCAPTAVFDYVDFGPQSMAFDFIGYERWQWEPRGNGDLEAEYPIKVVVHSDADAEIAETKYPVSQEGKKDFRYVSYSESIGYLDKNLAELAEAKADGMAFDDLTSTLETTKAKVTEDVCPS